MDKTLPPKDATPRATPYKPLNRGYPVQAGQTWQDLTPEQRQEWMHQHETHWRTRYNANAASLKANLGWTRG